MPRLALTAAVFFSQALATAEPIADTPFVQEFAEHLKVRTEAPKDPNAYVPKSEEMNDVRGITFARDGRAVIATKAGVYFYDAPRWDPAAGGPVGTTFCVYVDAEGTLWAGAWDGVYRYEEDHFIKEPDIDDAAIVTFGTFDSSLIALGPDGFFVRKDGAWTPLDTGWARSARATALGPDGTLYVATHSGLFLRSETGQRLCADDDDITSTYVNAVKTGKDGKVWVACMGGIDVFEKGARTAHYGTEDGVPNFNPTSLAVDPDGRLWVGSELGAFRLDGKSWSLRHTLRWLPSDDVRGIAFDKDGSAWIATAKGVGVIRQRSMTLADKAVHYETILRERHVRPPGLVEKCELPDPTNLEYWKPVDDDNDGSYTAMYMAAECLRYQVTKDPEAKEFADEAWNAVAFLHEVTGGNGFVARTVVPATWTKMADENRGFTPEEAAQERVDNPRFMQVEHRWRISKDHKWRWKGDTSSDEIVGHFYAFNMYYHLAADETQKEQVRTLIRRLMDYIISGDYMFIDPVTGDHTLWGMWNPEHLNHDPDWRSDAPINCTEMLSFLLLTASITGDEKYKTEFDRLFKEEHYGDRLTHPKSYGRTERTHIDDDLLSMVFPTFVLNDTESANRPLWQKGAAWVYSTIEHDVNPMFNFTYAWAGVPETHNDDSVAFLRDTPLDLRQFAVDSSKREDVKLRRFPIMEEWQTDRVLPPSERGTMRWDKNPWAKVAGDFGDAEGHTEASGTYWLLPYWLGRYLNIIGAPQTN